jgi:hypothetical protein
MARDRSAGARAVRSSGVFALLALLAETFRAFVPPGTLPKGSRVEIVQVETGWFESREIGEEPEEPAEFRPPTGALIVSVFGPDGRARGFARLLAKRGEEVAIRAPASPERGRGQLALELTLPKDARPDPKDLSLVLSGHEKKLLPDVFVVRESAPARAYWLDVPAGAAAVALASKEWTLAKPLHPDVPERGALSVRGELVPKPSLRLRFGVPEGEGHGTVELDLLDCEKQRNFPGPTPIELCVSVSSRKEPFDSEFVFKDLDPSLFAVRWKLGKWTDTLTVDVESAGPTVRTIAIRPFEVSGRVTAGGTPAAARLRFWAVNTGLAFETEADDYGNYRIALVRRGQYQVGIRRPGFEPFAVDLELEGDEPRDEWADFAVPANRVIVRIFDAESGLPIPSAAALVTDLRQGPSFGQGTDDSGLATLPPLKKGSYEITATAKGYQRSAPQTVLVDESTRDKELEFRLPKSAGPRLRVLDAGGEPLAGASVCAMSGANVITGMRTGADGIVVLPNPFPSGQPLAAWDTGGRIGVFRWSGDDEQDLVIPPSALPILVRFVSADGQPRPRWAPAFSIDGVQIPLFAERFTSSGGDAISRPDGTFRLAGLPSSGLLALWPFGLPELAVTRPLPVSEEIVFTVPPR